MRFHACDMLLGLFMCHYNTSNNLLVAKHACPQSSNLSLSQRGSVLTVMCCR